MLIDVKITDTRTYYSGCGTYKIYGTSSINFVQTMSRAPIANYLLASLVLSSRVILLMNFVSLQRTSGVLSVDSAPARAKVLARGDSSRGEGEEKVVEDGGL